MSAVPPKQLVARGDWKLRSLARLLTKFRYRKLVNEVIEGGPKILNAVANDRFERPEFSRVLSHDPHVASGGRVPRWLILNLELLLGVVCERTSQFAKVPHGAVVFGVGPLQRGVHGADHD